MQAIDFIVRDHTGFVQHGSLIESGISDTLNLGDDGAVSLNMRRADVREYLRAGENLELYLADGRKIVLDGFFAENGVQENKLYLNEDGTLIEASLDASGHVTFTEAATWGKWSHLDAMVFPESPIVAETIVAAEGEDVTQALGLGLLGAGGGAAAGILPAAGAVVAGGALIGGSDGDSGATVDNPDTPVSVGGPDDESITITGTGTPGATVEVTIGDKTVTTTVGEDGTWEAVFEGDNFPGDGNYDVDVTVTDEDGTVHDPDAPSVTIDTTPPVIEVTGGTQSVGVTVNADDHSDGVEISGNGEAGASIDVEINGTTHSTTVGENGSWTVTFSSTEITTGEYETDVKITSKDSFGNASTVTETLVVDTVAEVSLNGGFAGSDDLINMGEASAGITLTGTAQPGSTVMVNFHGTDMPATVDVNGNWTLNVSSTGIPEGKYEAAISVTATDAHGNTKTINSAVDVDTTAGVTFSSAPVEGDNVINATEVADGVVLTGQALPGATVSIAMSGGGSYNATVAADGSWSVNIPGGDFNAGEYDVTFTATATSPAGNVATSTLALDVDTLVQPFGLDANSQLADNVLNGSEVDGGLTLNGTTEPGATVQVKIGNETKDATVDGSGNWTVDFSSSDIPAGEYATFMTITSTDQAGNVKEMKQGVTVDTVAGDVALSSQPVELDDVINAQEASDGVIISGTATPFMDVTVTLHGVSKVVTASATGEWSAPFLSSEVASGEYTANVSASITDAHGNSKSVSDTVEVDTLVTNFAMTTDPVAGDNVINAQELSDGVVLSGTVEAGSTVQVKIGTNPAQSATVDASGNWTITVDAGDVAGGELSSAVAVTATDAAGNTADISKDIKIDTIVTNLGISAGAVAGDDIVNATEIEAGLTFTGTTEPGSTVLVSLDGGTPVQATVAANGNWTVDFAEGQIPTGDKEVTMTVTATDAAGNVGTVSDTFDVDTVAPDAPDGDLLILGSQGIKGLFVDSDPADLSLDQLNPDGSVSQVSGFDLNAFNAGSLPDGSKLVLTEEDAAGNATSTLFITNDGAQNLDLSAAGLSGYNVEAIDLIEVTEDNSITITEQQLLDLSDNSNELTIHGGSGDTVTADGASATGQTVAIDGADYHVYTLGTDGGTLYIQEDVNVVTVI
ncbi:Ig-like domain-containing protein [Aliiroseovarius lamellibrachiae]|uniref:Ig-like domain-containing protein n=1 Tax=Aliiroseovarius lamellibrachiae TaxID=1924933 RepID=UPI001BE0C6B7|nr:Ig-like domain-containing protein [Aliiroseovarius lamellibrachiae]MBT2131530.1 RTX toxin [Aliiroseovarius lamellibrachiae]